MNKNDKPIITGSITNVETEETTEMSPHYLFCSGFIMTTFAKVTNIDSYEYEDGSFQVSIDSLALDSNGNVYNLGLEFDPKSIKERDAVLKVIHEDEIYSIKGEYTCINNGASIIIYNPVYSPIPPDFSEEEIREVFEFNGKQLSAEDSNS